MKKFLPFILLFAVAFSLCGYGCEKERDRTVYEINCELSGNVLTGSETVEFYNFTDNAFGTLKFNLYGNAFRKDAEFSPVARQYASKAYPSGKSYGDMRINGVTGESGALEYEICGQDENILSVALPEEVFPGDRASVTVDFTLSLAEVVARTGVNADTVNLANFYPALCGIQDGAFYECVYYSNGDPFFSDCADYTVTLAADENMVVAATGVAVKTERETGKNVTTYKAENVRSFAFVLSEKFESVTDKSTGADITYYYYKDENPSLALNAAVQAASFFAEKFGAYPYPAFSVVQTHFIQGGMEFPGLAMVSDALESKAYLEVIVHETAHQWWQSVVGNNEIEYGFLDEGLAEYSVIAFYETHPEYGFTRANLVESAERTYKTFCTVYDKLFGKVNTVMPRSLKDFDSEYEYVNVAYVKPAIMYDVLRTTIGDEKFFGGLKRYYADFAFKNAVPSDLVASFTRVGADVEGFFDGFFNGKAVL